MRMPDTRPEKEDFKNSKIPKGKYKTEYLNEPLLMERLVKLMHQIEQKLQIKISVTIKCNRPLITSVGGWKPVIIHKGNTHGKNKSK